MLLIIAAAAMPWLPWQKRRLSAATGSAALRADAAESSACGYLALIALAGLAISAIWGVGWADPVAALALLPLIARGTGSDEGKTVLRRNLSRASSPAWVRATITTQQT